MEMKSERLPVTCQIVFLLLLVTVSYCSACSCPCKTDGPCKDIDQSALAELGVKYLNEKAAEGLTETGPKPGSFFARLMSHTSKQNGGQLPKDSFVSKLQSLGTKGWKDLSAKIQGPYDTDDVPNAAKVLECCRCSCTKDEL